MPRRSMKVHRDKKKVTGSQILGAVGGTLNLWIGISFVTAVELCELIYNICKAAANSMRDKKAEKQNRVVAFKE